MSDADFHRKPSKYSRAIIKGTAGAGKTMLMKHLVLETFQHSDRIPIFIDLRDIEDPRKESFLKSIFNLCTPAEKKDTFKVFNAGLRTGVFSFFFDGLDEVNPEYREATFRQMQRFPFDYPDVEVRISSRPETETSAFSIFPVLTLQKLSITQVKELLFRTEFHEEAKKASFVKKIDDGLYAERESFLSNPLLTLLMLMVYSDSGDLPERAALFYDQAFDTLYSRHDASKGPFRRSFRSKLHKDQFRTAFRFFCYRTLAKHQISFASIDIRSELERTIEICEYECTTEDLLHDMLESVCLLQRDGGKIHFIHRSFQEFFAADFMAKWNTSDRYTLIDTLLSDPIASKAGPLLYDIDQWYTEEYWVLPTVRSLLEMLAKVSKETPVTELVSSVGVSADYGCFAEVKWRVGDAFFNRLSTITTLYGERYEWFGYTEPKDVQAYSEGYQSFRDYVNRSPRAPLEFKEILEDETRARVKAKIELKSEKSVMRGYWELKLSEEHEGWLQETSLTNIMPSIKMYLTDLEADVSKRVSARNRIDILR